MNNEQNNNLNNSFGFMPTTGDNTNNSNSNVNNTNEGFSVPGANLNPIGGISPEPVVTTDSITSNTQSDNNLNSQGTNLGTDLSNANSTIPNNTPSQPSQEMLMNTTTISPVSNSENNTTNNVPLTNPTPVNNSNDNIVSVGKYLGHMFLFMIPFVGFILMLIKAFGEKNDKNISNFAKAQLLFMVICVVAGMILSIALTSVLGVLVKNMAY